MSIIVRLASERDRILTRLASARGQTLGEYAILITWLVLVVIVGATTLGRNLSHALSSTANRV